MAVDEEPFDDVRVRQAFRLIADRQALIDGALSGYGTIGNDLAGSGLPYYMDAEAPEQDLEQARSLLAEAGHENRGHAAHVRHRPGLRRGCDAPRGAGARGGRDGEHQGRPRTRTSTRTCCTRSSRSPSPSGRTRRSRRGTRRRCSDAVWNETHFRDEQYDELIQDAIGATDESSAQELWDEVQQRQLDEGGYIVWVYQNIVDAAAPNVGGITPSSFNLGGWNYRDVWLQA